MLKTFLLSRPYTVFDAENQEHRRAYFNFLKTNTWADCAYQFVLEEPYLDLPSCINYKMVQYYVRKEFKSNTKINTRLPKKSNT